MSYSDLLKQVHSGLETSLSPETQKTKLKQRLKMQMRVVPVKSEQHEKY